MAMNTLSKLPTQDAFEREYAARSNMTVQELREERIALPCGCGYEGCEGWAMVGRHPDTIAEHLALYAPGPVQEVVVGKFMDMGYRTS